LIQTIFFLYLLWACDTTVLVFFQWVYICTCKRLLSCQFMWKDLSVNISRSPFIKLSVYSIRFVIIKTFIKNILFQQFEVNLFTKLTVCRIVASVERSHCQPNPATSNHGFREFCSFEHPFTCRMYIRQNTVQQGYH